MNRKKTPEVLQLHPSEDLSQGMAEFFRLHPESQAELVYSVGDEQARMQSRHGDTTVPWLTSNNQYWRRTIYTCLQGRLERDRDYCIRFQADGSTWLHRRGQPEISLGTWQVKPDE